MLSPSKKEMAEPAARQERRRTVSQRRDGGQTVSAIERCKATSPHSVFVTQAPGWQDTNAPLAEQALRTKDRGTQCPLDLLAA